MTEKVNAYFKAMENEKNAPAGRVKAWQAWAFSTRSGSNVFETGDNLPWERDIRDFVETLRASGAKSILVTEESTALMRTLAGMEAEGCKVESMGTVSRKADPFDPDAVDGRKDVRGIVVRL